MTLTFVTAAGVDAWLVAALVQAGGASLLGLLPGDPAATAQIRRYGLAALLALSLLPWPPARPCSPARWPDRPRGASPRR